MKPMIVLARGLMDDAEIKLLRDNDLCVVVCKDPTKLKFFDPIPAAAQRGKIEDAAIKLSRIVLNWQLPGHVNALTKSDFAKLYVEALIGGTPLDPQGTYEEVERRVYDQAKLEEVRKLAKEDARAERFAKKQAAKPKTA